MLTMWTIYDHPSDCRLFFVARKWMVGKQGQIDTGIALLSPTLDGVRELLMDLDPNIGPHGRIPRDPKDHPCVVETWV